mmetsp:Transcript_106556/g.306462  ORF Transcript_106556/g.306462 Transcript_106556/m.306462 type:complete len:93 (+) Transcript_106556:949-1227(+)
MPNKKLLTLCWLLLVVVRTRKDWDWRTWEFKPINWEEFRWMITLELLYLPSMPLVTASMVLCWRTRPKRRVLLLLKLLPDSLDTSTTMQFQV